LYVLEGECEWQVGSQIVRAKPVHSSSFPRTWLTTSPT
jgi:hypothetical protein